MAERVGVSRKVGTSRAEKGPRQTTKDRAAAPPDRAERGDPGPVCGDLENPVRFEFEEIFTYGVSIGKFGGFSIPVNLPVDSDETEALYDAAEEHGVALKLYGRGDSKTLYLSCDQLDAGHRDELVGKKNVIIHVVFEATKTFKQKDGTLGFRFRVLGLKFVKVAERELDPAPERL